MSLYWFRLESRLATTVLSGGELSAVEQVDW